MAEPERHADFLLFPAFARGGTATVHMGRLMRAAGFNRVVVIKRLSADVADTGAAGRLLTEARLASRVRSPYVVPVIDVIRTGHSLSLVMDLVYGVTLARLIELSRERGSVLPVPVVSAIVGNALRGLHAAHEATGEKGEPLELVHRDVTPRNILVGADGLGRVLDFGIAKAIGDGGTTVSGFVRGTLDYVAPEQLAGNVRLTRQADLYASGVVLWEALTGDKLARRREGATACPPPSSKRRELPPALDDVVLRALSIEPSDRFASALAMVAALEAAAAPATPDDVGRVVEDLAFDDIERLHDAVATCERYSPPAPREHSPEAETQPSPPSTSAQQWEPVPGSLIASKYRVETVLGRGGMGVVFAARREPGGDPVAIKVVRAGGDVSTERVLREARSALAIESLHVVKVLDVGVDQGVPYLVMERLEGRDLRSILKERGPLPIREVVDWILQACDALAPAHRRGIVHRDLKPANLFLTTDARGKPLLKVLDFGIAKTTLDPSGAAPSLTGTADVIGSPAYMSPEQIRHPKTVDARADIWALGVVLYELLSGVHPFAGENAMAILARVYAEAPAKLSDVRPDVPAALVDVIESCLAKEVDARLQSVDQLIAALRPIADGTFAPSPPLRSAPRRRVRALPAVLVALPIVAIVGWSFSRPAHRIAPTIDAPTPIASPPPSDPTPITSPATATTEAAPPAPSPQPAASASTKKPRAVRATPVPVPVPASASASPPASAPAPVSPPAASSSPPTPSVRRSDPGADFH